MHMRKYITLAFIIFYITSCCHLKESDIPLNKGIYFGQSFPDEKPNLFAPSFISTGLNEGVITFTPDGKECYWSVNFSGFETILVSKVVDGVWTNPEIAPFSGKYYDGWPSIQPDGKRLFFHSTRPVQDTTLGISSDNNIWYMERIGNGWSEPKVLPSPINGKETSTCPTFTKTGNLYFSKRFSDGTEKLVRSKFVNGNYQDLEILPEVVNAMKYNFHGTISPDESYIIRPLYGRSDAIGDGWNYYVSFHNSDDTWTELVNLGSKVNTLICGGASSFSPDGKYLFFQACVPVKQILVLDKAYNLEDLIKKDIRTPGNGSTDFYWMNTTQIEELKGKK